MISLSGSLIVREPLRARSRSRLDFRVYGIGFRVQGLGFRVQGLGGLGSRA